MINEEQRQIIQVALKDSTTQEAILLEDMLKGLPKVEKETPGIIHGLCL